ncbi:M13 family metallopeptidase [Hyphomonas sp.]|uniref:M13 family metallopeptidase n=1 Tax=Hyphomonas sp. TaxID=87 RepID=UPI003528DEFD
MRVRLLALAVSVVGFTGACSRPPPQTPDPVQKISLPPTRVYDAAAIDPSADACTDFYQYACGGWETSHPRPADSGSYYRSWTQYAREVDDYVRQLIEAAGSGAAAGEDERNVATFFQACMNEPAIEAAGLAPFAPLFSEIDALDSAAGAGAALGKVSGRLKKDFYTKFPLLRLSPWADPSEGGALTRIFVSGDVIGFPAQDYYIDPGEEAAALRAAYVAYLAGTLTDLGYPEPTAQSFAERILALETAISSAGQSAAEERNEAAGADGLASLEDVAAAYPNIDWAGLLAQRGADPLPDAVFIADAEQIAVVNDWMTDENLDVLKAYLKLALVVDYNAVMPATFRSRNFDFFSRKVRGHEKPPPRWRTCVGLTKVVMPEAVSRMFIASTGIGESKAASLGVFADIRDEMHRRIDTADWIGDDTRAAALAKLGQLRASFVAPDAWLDDPALKAVPDAAAATALDFSMSRRLRDFAQAGTPMDINDWFDPPIYVSGFQVNETNAIYVTAAQMLMLDIGSGDLAVEYAGLGVFVAHELSHGYDRLGSQYDGAGRTRDWWTEADGQAFDGRMQCIAEEASTYAYPSGDPVNGALVVSEEAAQMTGLDLAYAAFQRARAGKPLPERDGLTADQRFFTAAAQTFCIQASEESWRFISSSDSHMWGAPGINMVMKNSPAFAAAFNCKAGDPMVKPEADVCRTW